MKATVPLKSLAKVGRHPCWPGRYHCGVPRRMPRWMLIMHFVPAAGQLGCHRRAWSRLQVVGPLFCTLHVSVAVGRPQSGRLARARIQREGNWVYIRLSRRVIESFDQRAINPFFDLHSRRDAVYSCSSPGETQQPQTQCFCLSISHGGVDNTKLLSVGPSMRPKLLLRSG